jgi:hypothetical protein
MDWQTITAWLTVTLAGAYLLWRGARALRGGKSGCSGECGCSKSSELQTKTQPDLIAPESLVLRKRE